MSLITGDLWRKASWLNLSFKSMRLLEITICRQLINQLVVSFGYRQTRLYVSKFFEPNLRSHRKIQKRVVQTGYLFRHIIGHIVYIPFSICQIKSSPHLKSDWAAVVKSWLDSTQLVVSLTSWASIYLLALSYYPESNFSVRRRVLSLQSSKYSISHSILLRYFPRT